MLPGYAGGTASQVQGLIGVLSSTTSPGASYAVSVGVALKNLAESVPGYFNPITLVGTPPVTFELRLRSSATGAESAPVLQASLDQTISWVPITGTVTASAAYDQVVLRFLHPQEGDISTRMGLVDDVRLCQSATAPATPNLPLGSTLGAAVKQTIPPPGPTCATDAANLVQNASFESVTGTPYSLGEWPVYEALLGATSGTATTQVTGWTRTNAQVNWPMVAQSGSPWAPARLAFQGAKYALVPPSSSSSGNFQGLVGTLSSATIASGTYVVSAAIATDDLNIPTFELRLRNSATGAESDAAVQTSSTLTTEWGRVTGTVTANAAYDRVVLRYQAPLVAGSGLASVDDVRVCEATSALVAGEQDLRIIGILIGLLLCMLLLGGLVVRSRFEPLTDGLLVVRSRFEPLTDGLLVVRSWFEPLTDGLLLVRSRFEALTDGWGLRTIRPALDVDGNGQADALTERSISGSVGDPHETTGDGSIVSSYSVGGSGSENDAPGIPKAADYDGDGITGKGGPGAHPDPWSR